jgi:hypothetical protein
MLRRLVCERKVPLGRAAAMSIAERARARGERRGAYRCPFGPDTEDRHWHTGRPPSMETLEEIAEYLRDRHAGTV